MSGSLERRYSSTTMPRPHASPASSASPLTGSTPIATPTMSHGIAFAGVGLHRNDVPVLAEDPSELGEVVDFHAGVEKPLLDDARLGLGEHVAPVAVLAHEVVDVHSMRDQPLHDLKRRDAPADDHGLLGSAASADQLAGVVHVVELENAFQLDAGCLGGDRLRTGCDEQTIVGELSAALQSHAVPGAVDAHGSLVKQPDLQAAEVLRGEGKERLLRHLFGQVVGESRTRVVAVALGAQDYDVGVGVQLPNRLSCRDGRRSAADYHVAARHLSEPSARGARVRPAWRAKSSRSAAVLADSASRTRRRSGNSRP